MAASKRAGEQPGRVGRLVAVRDALADAIAGCESKRDLAALSREYRAVLAELESLAPQVERKASGVDEIGRRRAARRRADTADQGDAGGAGG